MANAKFFNLITLDKVKEAFKKCNYSFFENGDYNLNIFSIRNTEDRDSNKFNDGEEIDKSKIYGKVVLVISNFGAIYAFLLNNYLYIFIGIIMLSLLVFLIHIWRKNEGRRNNWISS